MARVLALRKAARRVARAILSALDWVLGCAQVSQLRRSSSASRADYESKPPTLLAWVSTCASVWSSSHKTGHLTAYAPRATRRMA